MGYSRKDLEELYENNPNELGKIFMSVGIDSTTIQKLFNSYPKSELIDEVMKILRYSQFDEKIDQYYSIPLKYKEPEYELFRKDREDDYNEMNNSIDKITGETLQALYDYDADKYFIGIHRTAALPEEIFQKGLKMRGTDIDDHVQIMENFCFMLREIKYCEGYKFSQGCFIVKVPKKSVKGNVNEAEPIYYVSDDGKIYLRPEFITAYVPVCDRKIGKVEMNKYPHNIYSDTTEFLYDDSLNKGKTYGFINIFLISISIIVISSIIFLILK